MAEPQQLDTDPTDSDDGKDFSYLVPKMGVNWGSVPSYNDTQPPISQEGGGSSVTDVADSGPILFDADTVRATENTLLAQNRNAVADYETLRAQVDFARQGSFFGPKHPETPTGYLPPLNANGGDAYQEVFNQQERANEEKLAELGDEAARKIDPVMQKALALISEAIETGGNFLAAIHASGQAYASLDRGSRFPGPPGSIRR
ncbi:hypothetical protein [Streptomyces sp. NBC_01455]|uniref:hypothetical protein n=1 Tax=Streptomyces sp. NBC_01455 TaxID=2903874 RepID=UPI002E32B4BC|nr:hypothetical protein [Streptomyces sp. NBC_01455]